MSHLPAGDSKWICSVVTNQSLKRKSANFGNIVWIKLKFDLCVQFKSLLVTAIFDTNQTKNWPTSQTNQLAKKLLNKKLKEGFKLVNY